MSKCLEYLLYLWNKTTHLVTASVPTDTEIDIISCSEMDMVFLK